MKTNKEKFLELVSEYDTGTMERNKWRIRNRWWLKIKNRLTLWFFIFRDKLFFILTILFITIIFYGCSQSTAKKDKIIDVIGGNIFVYTIDSCEYIGRLKGTNGDWATHKGNCKYCKDRLTKQK